MSSPDKPEKITLQMTVLEVVSQYRQAEAVFRSYDAAAGECICCNALFDSLGDVAAKYRLDLDRLITDLEQAVRED